MEPVGILTGKRKLRMCPTTLEVGWLAYINDPVANSGGNTYVPPTDLFKSFVISCKVPSVNAEYASDRLP